MSETVAEVQSPYELERWVAFKCAKKAQQRFGYFLAPIMEHIYQTCCQQISSSHYLHKIIDNKLILKVLTKQFETVLTPMVLKCCLWEMHVAKKNGELFQETAKQRFEAFIESMQASILLPIF